MEHPFTEDFFEDEDFFLLNDPVEYLKYQCSRCGGITEIDDLVLDALDGETDDLCCEGGEMTLVETYYKKEEIDVYNSIRRKNNVGEFHPKQSNF